MLHQLACETAAQQYHRCSMKGEMERLVAVVVSWLSGYGGYSQTPWVGVPQLPVFSFLLSPQAGYFQRNIYNQIVPFNGNAFPNCVEYVL